MHAREPTVELERLCPSPRALRFIKRLLVPVDMAHLERATAVHLPRIRSGVHDAQKEAEQKPASLASALPLRAEHVSSAVRSRRGFTTARHGDFPPRFKCGERSQTFQGLGPGRSMADRLSMTPE